MVDRKLSMIDFTKYTKVTIGLILIISKLSVSEIEHDMMMQFMHN